MFGSSCSSHTSCVTCPCDTFDSTFIFFLASIYISAVDWLYLCPSQAGTKVCCVSISYWHFSHIKFIKEIRKRDPTPFLNSVIALMRPHLTSWCILIFRAATPPMKYNASPLPIVLPRWQPSLGRLAREAVGMVPTGPRVVGLDVELRVTHLACPKKGGRW